MIWPFFPVPKIFQDFRFRLKFLNPDSFLHYKYRMENCNSLRNEQNKSKSLCSLGPSGLPHSTLKKLYVVGFQISKATKEGFKGRQIRAMVS